MVENPDKVKQARRRAFQHQPTKQSYCIGVEDHSKDLEVDHDLDNYYSKEYGGGDLQIMWLLGVVLVKRAT
jgi:hypothetical protein